MSNPDGIVPEEANGMAAMNMGDWVAMTKPAIRPLEGIEGCPLCDGQGQYYDKDCPGDGWICTRCTTHALILQRLPQLKHSELRIVRDLVVQFTEKT